MKNLKGTKTEQNLKDAFAGESQARNRYGFFASVAKKEGYEQMSRKGREYFGPCAGYAQEYLYAAREG